MGQNAVLNTHFQYAPPVTDLQQVPDEHSQNHTATPGNEELDTIAVPAPAVDDDDKADAMEDGPPPEEKEAEPTSGSSASSDTSTTGSRQPSIQDGESGEPRIPPRLFAPLLIEFLLDQNSTLASLGQQCIVSVASELASTRGTQDEEKCMQLLDSEIYDGIVLGLMRIVEGRQRPQKEMEDQEDLDEADGFQSSVDDENQGEINLAKMMCLSVSSLGLEHTGGNV